MKFDKDGFLQPDINYTECIECGKCDDVCPVLHSLRRNNFADPVCYAAWNKNEKVRQNSTSGGIFTALSDYVFSQNGIVYGVVINDEQIRPYHTFATTKEALDKMRGSKYLQSDTGLIYRHVEEVLLSNKYVLFSGCPCQIAGLYAFLENKEFEKLITCEVVCHGVPSVSVFDWYKAIIETKENSTIVDVNFRSKKFGWEISTIEFELRSGEKIAIKAKHCIWYSAFYASLCIRKACTECSYATLPRIADFTIGDYWHATVQNYPKEERQQGISLILINNEKAIAIFSDIKDNMFFKAITLQDATKENTNIDSLGKANPKRDDFLAEYAHSDPQYLMKKYFPVSLKGRIASLMGKRLIYRMKAVIKNT